MRIKNYELIITNYELRITDYGLILNHVDIIGVFWERMDFLDALFGWIVWIDFWDGFLGLIVGMH